MSNNEEDYNNEEYENESMIKRSVNTAGVNNKNMKNSSMNTSSMNKIENEKEEETSEATSNSATEEGEEGEEGEGEEEEKNKKNVLLTGKASEDNAKATAAASLGKPNSNINNPNKNKNTTKNTKKNMGNKNKNLGNESLTMKNISGTTGNASNTNTNTEEQPSASDVTTAESQIESEGTIKTNSEQRVSLNRLCMNLLNHQIVIKLFHFQTQLFGAHKASDAYIEKYANTLDKFLEVAQGIYGKITLKKYSLAGSSHSDDNIIKHINGMIMYWREKIDDILGNYTDLINIRDELVGDAEQLKYLLSFK